MKRAERDEKREGGREKMTGGQRGEGGGESMRLDLIYSCDTLQSF